MSRERHRTSCAKYLAVSVLKEKTMKISSKQFKLPGIWPTGTIPFPRR